MKKAILIFSALFFTIALFESCDKTGCTDPDSMNYDPKATQDDGSCQYQGQVVLWFDKTTRTKLLNMGAISLTYFLDGYEVGKTSAAAAQDAEPGCGQAGPVTATKNIGNVKTLSVKYEVYETGTATLYFSGNVTVVANQCVKVKLVK
ncbi:MAG TPA: hypothetical protein P5050_11615 [Bacteroidia bacterium]|nr:hypothetical protein [Bacteroidia bacterium]HRS59853.1 hypothetical protein [Bacteroidia bacterium]HRU68895.1 hypothetical protein [Bacteroidia bacterium]